MAKRKYVSIEQRPMLLRDWLAAKPKKLHEIEAWAEKMAVEYDVAPQAIRNVLAQETAVFHSELKSSYQTPGQQMADMAGATLLEGLLTIRRNLKAKRRKHFMHKGSPLMLRKAPEETEWTLCFSPNPNDGASYRPYFELVDDGKVQVAAAKLIVDIHGALAPQMIEVKHDIGDNLQQLGEADLMQRSQDTIAGIVRLLTEHGVDPATILGTSGTTSPIGEPRTSEAGTRVPKGRGGRFLLGNESDSDDGRAGKKGD